MAEDPIKLFSSRADRLPQPDDRDRMTEMAEKVIGTVPGANLVAAVLSPHFLVPAINRRRDEWLKELADDFDRLSEECNVENVVRNEAFISASIQATRIALATHQEEKRQYLRNALLNIALGKGPDELRQQIFLNAIEAFAPAHVKALDAIRLGRVPWDEHKIPLGQRNYGSAIEIFTPELKGEPSLMKAVLADLRNRGFSNLDRADYPFPEGGLVTNLGVEFLRFVRTPAQTLAKGLT